MIQSFADRKTERLFREGDCPAAWRSFDRIAMRKLDMLDYALQLGDLRSLPGNRLEALRGDRKGQWSIRINDQWRVYFAWSEQGPRDVEIVDCH